MKRRLPRGLPHRLAIALLLLGGAMPARAVCESGLAERMHARLHPDRMLDHRLALCEPWRGMLGRQVVVLPLPRPSSVPGFGEIDLDVLLVQQADNGNTEHTQILSRLFEPAALVQDVIRIERIKLDASRFRLADDQRAFGLRIQRQGTARLTPYASESLSLYLPRGARLAKVLDRLEVRLERGEWSDGCEGRFESVTGQLAVLDERSHGLRKLVLRETFAPSRSNLRDGECVVDDGAVVFTAKTLAFDGARYAVEGPAGPPTR